MRVIVSLTTTSGRLKNLPAVLHTIARQTVTPEGIQLWISEEPYLLDQGVIPTDLPAEVRALAEGPRSLLTIRTTENIGPHRKVLPLVRELHPEPDPPLVVTADDDTLYPVRWLEALVAGFEERGCAVAFRARRLARDGLGPAPYRDWPLVTPQEETFGYRLVPTGNDGILLHPHMLHEKYLTDSFRELCPSRCDIWLAAGLMAAGTPVLKLSKARVFPDGTGLKPEGAGDFPRVSSTDREGPQDLHEYNAPLNDEFIRRTFEYFRLWPYSRARAEE